jgi:hypothetical protein
MEDSSSASEWQVNMDDSGDDYMPEEDIDKSTRGEEIVGPEATKEAQNIERFARFHQTL